MNLSSTYLRLRSDASAETLPVDAQFWPKLMSGALGDFHHEFLVTAGQHASTWQNWERHPNGDEIVCLLSGRVDFVLEKPDGEALMSLAQAGDFVFVPKGTWHTARVLEPAHLLFITAGEGTEHRAAAT